MQHMSKRIEYKPISELVFDPENPRLPKHIDRNDDTDIVRWMLSDATIIELMGSIGERGFFPGEPLLVIRTERSNRFIVVEGNRRLTAVKLLSDPSLAPSKKKSVLETSNDAREKIIEVPVLVYDHRSEILEYLGFRHITGVREWGPLAKARYLEQLQKDVQDLERQAQFKSLAKTIGSRADYVARLLTTLKVYEKLEDEEFFGIKRKEDDPVDFSVLLTAITYTNIARFIGLEGSSDVDAGNLDRNHLEEFTTWTFDKGPEGFARVRESRLLSSLSKVVGNDDALDAFRTGTPLAEAELLTAEPIEAFRRSVQAAKSHLETARNSAHRVDQPEQQDIDNLLDIAKLARGVKAMVEEQVLSLEDRR